MVRQTCLLAQPLMLLGLLGRVHMHPSRIRSTSNILLAWCFWLIGSWFVTIGPSAAEVAPRMMLIAATTGFLVLWPLVRLSQGSENPINRSRQNHESGGLVFSRDAIWPVRLTAYQQTIRDWMGLFFVYQAVIWPLMLNAYWTMPQTIWLNATLGGWSLLIALILGWGLNRESGMGRTIAMVGCLLVVLGEPVIVGMVCNVATEIDGLFWQTRFSPFIALWALAHPYEAGTLRQYQPQIITVTMAAILGWGIVWQRLVYHQDL